jgi:signal peptidase I
MKIPEPLRSVVSFATVAAVSLVARASLADHYRVPSGSMEPTVHTGDHVVVDKLAYGLRVPMTDTYAVAFGGPARGDVVVLDSPDSPDVLLKRVVATAGDRVEVTGGHVVIDGHPTGADAPDGGALEVLDHGPHELSFEYGGGPNFGPTVVPRDMVLVMGDNSGNSRDGRMFGFVPRGTILGRVEAVIARDGTATWLPL